MSKKVTDQQNQEAATPFFAHLLSSESDPAKLGPDSGPAPTYNCLDTPCTKKYPSDDDESTTWFGDRD
ncbi:MAG: microviridin/marinostatin family tricyclic proteinase inhibitor [Enhygromyxa sp.]